MSSADRQASVPTATSSSGSESPPLGFLLGPLAASAKWLLIAPLLAGLLTFAGSYLIAPVYTARATFLPPQSPQSNAAVALATLGTLGSLAGVGGALRLPADQYAALLQSETVKLRIVERFALTQVYGVSLKSDASEQLDKRMRVNVGRRDGMVSIDVDDHSPERAAQIANTLVEELRAVSAQLALTEAQQRRRFFETQLRQTRDRLAAAQQALQSSGFDASAVRAEPRATAEGFARLQAEVTAAEVRLQALRSRLTDQAPEVQSQLSALTALRAQLSRVEAPSPAAADAPGADYVGRYREFKYQEVLFEMFSRQYELARLDEAREGALIQVVDAATPPERKSRPRRTLFMLVGAATGLVVALLVAFARRPRVT